MAEKNEKAVAASTEKKPAKPVQKRPPWIIRTAKRIGRWFKELKSELKKVVWPSAKTVFKNTAVVLVVIIVVGVIIVVLRVGVVGMGLHPFAEIGRGQGRDFAFAFGSHGDVDVVVGQLFQPMLQLREAHACGGVAFPLAAGVLERSFLRGPKRHIGVAVVVFQHGEEAFLGLKQPHLVRFQNGIQKLIESLFHD